MGGSLRLGFEGAAVRFLPFVAAISLE
jgi:hypothetical protein